MKPLADKTIKAFEKFNADLKAFAEETEEIFPTLYEDAYTTRQVTNFRLLKNHKLKWVEMENGKTRDNEEVLVDDEDAREWLSFWRANLRRAKKYWSMDSEILDKIQDGELEDIE